MEADLEHPTQRLWISSVFQAAHMHTTLLPRAVSEVDGTRAQGHKHRTSDLSVFPDEVDVLLMQMHRALLTPAAECPSAAGRLDRNGMADLVFREQISHC